MTRPSAAEEDMGNFPYNPAPNNRFWLPEFLFATRPECISSTDRGEYMWRWRVMRWLGCEVKVHMFRRSDPDDLHDHPWWFISFLVAGSYTEVYEAKDGSHQSITRKAPSLAYRRAEHRHAVLLPNGPCVTLILSGARKRPWGFWVRCANGIKDFIHWKDYNGTHKC